MALSDNCIAYWRFADNAANTTVTDELSTYTGTANTYTNGLTTGGLLGNAFDFILDRITFGDNFDWGGNSFTFNFWVNPDSLSGNPVFIWKGDYDTNGYYLSLNGGVLDFVYKDGGMGLQRQTSVQTLSTGNWQMVSIVRSGVSIKLFINGMECTYSSVTVVLAALSANLQ